MLAGVFIFSSGKAAEKTYKLKKSPFALCNDLLPLLNAPENAEWRSAQAKYIPLSVPKRFKDFKAVTWNDLPKTEWQKLLYSIVLDMLVFFPSDFFGILHYQLIFSNDLI